MKFFIFTCLLAVAFAKHEPVNISQEEGIYSTSYEERARNMKEMEHFIGSSSEESGEVAIENKINPFYQKKNFLQYLQALHQPRIVRNPWEQINSGAYPLFSAVSREQLSTDEEIPKTIDMKTKLTKENKSILNLLNKMAQYHQKFPLPQHSKTVQYQTATKPWNHIKNNAYQIIPIVKYF